MTVEDFLLALVRSGLGNGCEFDVPEEMDWAALTALAEKQGVAAIACDGIQKVYESRPKGFRTSLDSEENKSTRRTWFSKLYNYECEYRKYVEAMNALMKAFADEGMKMMLLKGYGLSLNYPLPSHRPVGDIDIYSGNDFERSNAFVQSKGVKVNYEHHKHSVFSVKGYMVENHHSFLNVHGHKTTAKVESHLHAMAGSGVDCGSYYLPSADFNALYLLRHMGEHFASTGIKIRHVIDWGTFVSSYADDINWDWFLSMVDDLGMTSFLACVDGICIDLLGMSGSRFPELEYDSALMKRIVGDIFHREFSEKKPEGLIKIMLFKFRRWRANGWKNDLVFSDGRFSSFVSQTWSHILKPASIK